MYVCVHPRMKKLYLCLNLCTNELMYVRVNVYVQQVTRKEAVRLLLSYRAGNVRDRALWASILDECVVTTMPITPYRSFHKAEVQPVKPAFRPHIGQQQQQQQQQMQHQQMQMQGQGQGGSCRVLRGIDAVMVDSASLTLMAEGVGFGCPQWKSAIKK